MEPHVALGRLRLGPVDSYLMKSEAADKRVFFVKPGVSIEAQLNRPAGRDETEILLSLSFTRCVGRKTRGCRHEGM
jgi:hypothetical protein